jgi:hypothetical protein
MENKLTLIFLPKHLGQVDRHAHSLCPCLGIKAEFGLSSTFGDRRELEEIASDDDLDPTEWFIGVLANHLTKLVELVKHLSIHH